jgi:hypothetical protein
VDYNEAHLYSPVMRLELFRTLLTLSALSALYNLDTRQFDVSGDIDGEVYMEPHGYEDSNTVRKP